MLRFLQEVELNLIRVLRHRFSLYFILSRFELKETIGLGWIQFRSREPGVIAVARSSTLWELSVVVEACALSGANDLGSRSKWRPSCLLGLPRLHVANRGNVLS